MSQATNGNVGIAKNEKQQEVHSEVPQVGADTLQQKNKQNLDPDPYDQNREKPFKEGWEGL